MSITNEQGFFSRNTPTLIFLEINHYRIVHILFNKISNYLKNVTPPIASPFLKSFFKLKMATVKVIMEDSFTFVGKKNE